MPPDAQWRLLRDGGAALRDIRTATGVAIEVPPRGTADSVAVFGTSEQHARAGAALRVAMAGGGMDAVNAELAQSFVEALGLEGRGGRPICGRISGEVDDPGLAGPRWGPDDGAPALAAGPRSEIADAAWTVRWTRRSCKTS